MKNKLNFEIEFILNEKLSSLVSGPDMDIRFIGDIREIVLQNRNLAQNLSDVIVLKVLSQKSSVGKLRILYAIDSIIKNKGNEFLFYISPNIFRIFEQTFNLAQEELNEDIKLSLFKLYYSWKHFLDKNILDSICSHFHFNEMKNFLSREKPKLIEKYDKYNESVLENLKLEKEKEKEIFLNMSNTNKFQMNMKNNFFTTISNNKSRKIVSAQIPNLNAPMNINKSLLTRVLQDRNTRDSQQDDLFSSPNSSPKLSRDSSSEKYSSKYKQVDKKNKKKKNERVSEFADYFSNNINDFEIKKKKLDGSSYIKRDKEMIHLDHEIEDTSRRNISNTNQPMIIKPSVSALIPGQLNPIVIQQQIANLISNISQQQQISNISLQQQNPVKEIVKFKEREKEREAVKIPEITDAHNPFHDFINLSTVNLNISPYLFSSLSKFLTKTLFKGSAMKELMKDFKLKNPFDIFKFSYLGTKEYLKFYEQTIKSLSIDLKNCCTLCGYRTKFYKKFVEHLDIHFHINYIKRNSQKKVLYRKESYDKSNWIKQGTPDLSTKIDNSTFITDSNSYTLLSVLFYQNDSDFHVNAKKDLLSIENIEDNERLIIPVQYNQQSSCVYCGEEFRKKYINKFNYWFYVNVVKFNKDELGHNYQEMLASNKNNEYLLIHESCIEEYIKMLKYKDSFQMQLLKEKRNR